MEFLFELTSYDAPELLSQVARALEKRTEVKSREKLPGLWQKTDALRAKHPEGVRHPKRKRFFSWILVVLGLFLFIPGLTDPKNLPGPLIAGAAALLVGGFFLLGTRTNRFERSAQRLLKPLKKVRMYLKVRFAPEGIYLHEQECISYKKCDCCVETEDLFLLTFENRVTVLKKTDLVEGDLPDLIAFLKEKTNYLEA